MGAQPDQSTGILLELMHENAAAQTSSVVDGPALGVVVLTIARMPEALQRALQSPTDYAGGAEAAEGPQRGHTMGGPMGRARAHGMGLTQDKACAWARLGNRQYRQ